MATKTNLTKAFADLRRCGLFARQGFTCCMSCGWAGVEDALARKPQTRGAVFYHAQDAEDLRAGHDFYLAYGPGAGAAEMPAAEVGSLVQQVLAQHGVETEWDGDPDTRIKVKAATVRVLS